MNIYITHCSAKKKDSLQGSGTSVSPDSLYTATPIQRFMKRCKREDVRWAIFSDLYGVWYPDRKRTWYEKSPDSVTPEELERLVSEFDEKLSKYKKIIFYHNPGRFHPLYKKVISKSRLKARIQMITHIDDIGEADE